MEIKKSHIILGVFRITIVLILVVLLVLVVTEQARYISSEQAFINTKLITLRAPISGTLSSFDPLDGSSIQEGTPLFEISNPLFADTVTYTQYENLQDRIHTLRNEVAQEAISIRKNEKDFTRLSRLIQEGAAAKKDFDEVESNLDLLKSTVKNKQEQLARLQDIDQEIEKQLELQKKASVKAPCTGVLWAIMAKEGEEVKVGDELAQMVSSQDIWVDAFFNEGYVPQMYPGMPVIVKELGSQRSWDGQIVFIRAGSGRINYGSVVETPPQALMRRLVAVRVRVDWKGDFKPSEFYGIGRSLVVLISRHHAENEKDPASH